MNDTSETLVLNHNDDQLRVHALGAKLELQLTNIPILYAGPRGDGKTGITHTCTPIFGPDRNNLYGLSQHGKMRTEECLLTKINDAIVVTHKISDAGYPTGIEIVQTLTLRDRSFSLTMVHTNKGNQYAALNPGEHFYFDAPKSYKGTNVNGRDISEMIENNVNGAVITLQEINTLAIPGKPEYELKQQGFSVAMVWVGRNPKTGEIDNNYVCIEPVENDPQGDYFGSAASMLKPGANRTSSLQLSLKSK